MICINYYTTTNNNISIGRSQALPQHQGQLPSTWTCKMREHRDSGDESKLVMCIIKRGREMTSVHHGKSHSSLSLWQHCREPVLALSISFTNKESFKPTLKHRAGVCLLNQHWKIVPQARSWTAEGSASHSTFGDSRNHRVTLHPESVAFQWGNRVLLGCRGH